MGCLLAIRRDRPDRATYWVLPGGHVDPDDQSLEAALSRTSIARALKADALAVPEPIAHNDEIAGAASITPSGKDTSLVPKTMLWPGIGQRAAERGVRRYSRCR
jgi:hypothetical protein